MLTPPSPAESSPDQSTPGSLRPRNRMIRVWGATILFAFSIVVGSILGVVSPASGSAVGGLLDGTILLLVTLLLFEVQFRRLRGGARDGRFLAVAWVANFIAIPALAFVIASLFLSGEPLLFVGVMIYFVSPCTDWFLGFTRMAHGNTSLGAVLLPLNMITQLVLFPLFLILFAKTETGVDPLRIVGTLLQWFIVPLVIAALARLALHFLASAAFARVIRSFVARIIPFTIAAVILQIFAANVGTILSNAADFAVILIAVFFFFVATFALSEALSRLFRFDYPEHALLTMTTAARNAPLMLALTVVALPNEPLVYSAIIIGMLIEFPHLTAITQILLRRRRSIRVHEKSVSIS